MSADSHCKEQCWEVAVVVLAPPSRKKRGGDRGARRQRQRTKREVLRGDCTLSKAVDAMLSTLYRVVASIRLTRGLLSCN